MTTPRVALLLQRVRDLSVQLSDDLDRLSRRLKTSDECLVLKDAPWNIVDRQADKRLRRQGWTVTLGELVSEEIESEPLTEASPSTPSSQEAVGCLSDDALPQTRRRVGGSRSRGE